MDVLCPVYRIYWHLCALYVRQGAVSVEEEEREKEQERTAAFHGAGFRLGDMEGPGMAVANQRPLPPKPETVRYK